MPRDSRRDNGSKLRFLRPLLAPLRITGNTKALPDDGLIVFVNHSSLIDPFFVYLALRKEFGRKIAFMAAAGLWKIPILGLCFKLLEFIPVYRKSNDPSSALAPAIKAVRAGRVVAVYFEGGIHYPSWWGSTDRLPTVFKTGPARIWFETKAPILPLVQLGARRVMSGNWWKQFAGVFTAWWRRFFYNRELGKPQVRVHFGDLIDAENATGDPRKDTDYLKNVYLQVFKEAQEFAA